MRGICSVLATLVVGACSLSGPEDRVSGPMYQTAIADIGFRDQIDGEVDTAWEYYLSLAQAACGERDELRCELFRRVSVDTYMSTELARFSGAKTDEAMPFDMPYAAFSLAAGRIKRSDDHWMKQFMRQGTWFEISKFGADADAAAFLLIQHSNDTQLQQEALRLLEAARQVGETDPRNVALLHDRVAIKNGELQTYATQGDCAGVGNWEPFPVENADEVDALRTQMQLPPLDVYKGTMAPFCT